MSMQPSPRNVKYEEEVRVQWGFGPKRAGPDSSRNRGRLRVWRTYKVEMEHSADRGYFRVKFQPSDAHCIEYCRDELDDEGEEPMPDSWFDSTCECGLVHDGSGHDTEESEGAGSVYNVQPSRQRGAQLPPQLPPQLPRGDDRTEWWSDDEDINLTVLQRTGVSGPMLFLTDEDYGNFVEAVVFRFSGDGMERSGPSVKLEYASEVWLQHVDPDGAEDAEDAGATGAEDSEDAGAAEQAADARLADAETEDFETVADGFLASTPAASDESIYYDSNDDSCDGDSDSDSSAGHCWYYAHSDRILHLLSEWLDRMQREHGLLGRMPVFGAPHEGKSDWYRPLPGLARPVAWAGQERPHKGPSLRTLRAREVGGHKLLGGASGGARQKWNTCFSASDIRSVA